MESVGDFEYNTKDLIGHGAFAVVFKGRHKTKHHLTVAIKSITKKNLAKSQNLLEKEIKILKELTKLHHENVVALLDCKETAQHVYLVMEYCNGGDLADYLHDKGTLSEDTIRMFLRQIAGAMKALNAKGIVHRDLKPQNILLCHSVKQSPIPGEITLKIADFGFARFLQDGVMAVTLCGSPMYMAPEVIMSLQYTAKADLWSIGTIVFQCLTGKAPFQAQTPQALKQFYERNMELVPKIPSGTSAELIDLLLKLLKRNAADRLEFDIFFTHPFLKPITKLSSPVPVPSRRSMSPDISSPVLTASPFGSPLSGNLPPSPLGWCTEQGGEDLAQDINLPTSSSEEAQISPVYREKSCPSSPEEQDFVMVPESLPYDMPDGSKQMSAKWQQPDILHRTPSNSSLPRKSAVHFTADGGAYYPTGKSSSPTGSPRPSALPVTCSGTTTANKSGSNGSSHAYSRTEPIPVPTQRETYEQIQRSLQDSMSASPRSRSGHTAERSIPSPISPPASPKPVFPRSQPINVCQDSGSSHSSDRGGRMSTDISSLSPPTVQFTIGTPPGVGRRRSLSGSTPPQSVIWQNPPHIRQSNTPPSSLLSNSPIRRSSTNPHPAFNNGNPLSPIIGSPPKGMSKTEQALWSLKCRNETGLQGLDSLKNVTNVSGPLQMAFGTRTMTLPEINSQEYWQGNLDRKETAEQFNYELQRAGSAGKICDKTMMKASGGSVCGIASHSPPGPRMVGYRETHCPYWHTGAWEGHASRVRHSSTGLGGRYSESSPTFGTSPPNMEGAIMFIAPELPEETLLEKEHNETLAKLNFVLALVDCILDLAKSKSTPIAALTESLMYSETNSLSGRIAVTSEGYRRAEQLVLYMRALQLLSSSLQLSRQEVQSGRLQPSTSVKNVLQSIKERFHFCLNMCKTLNSLGILHSSGVDPNSSNITADRLIYNYAIEMCQSAALEELFGNPEECFRRYQTAQILLHSLAQQVDHDDDKKLLFKYKEAVEKRLFVLQRHGFAHAYDTT